MTEAQSHPAEHGQPNALRVSLGVFDGPLDLLLHLVRERELDIETVPLAALAQQYFEYVSAMRALDVELAAEYLVIAATLLFLKSRSLLPPVPSEFLTEGEETPEQIEERLRRRLIAYSKYKAVSLELRARMEEAASFFYRDAGDPQAPIRQRYKLAPARLASALIAAIREARPERRTIVRERYSVARQMEYVARTVNERRRIEFSELCRGLSRDGVIVTFLAILELIRLRRLAFKQDTPERALRLFPFRRRELHAN